MMSNWVLSTCAHLAHDTLWIGVLHWKMIEKLQ
jgi:hypothetical protein